MQSTLLRAITRRHFFKQSGFGIGGLALSALLDERLLAQTLDGPLAPKAPHFAPKAKNIIYLFMAGAPDAARPLRLQAGTAGARRPGDPARAHSQGGALRLHQRDTPAARITVHVQAIRTIRRGALRAAAASRQHRRRHRDRPFGAHDAVQPCARSDLHEYREPGVRQAEHGVVAHVRSRQRQPRSAGLHRAALGRERARRRKVVLGQRIPSDGLPGRGVQIEGRSRCCSCRIRRGVDERRAQGVDRSGDRPRTSCIGREVGDPEIDTRIASYEMAYRMQSSVPELTDISGEPAVDSRDVRHRARQGVVREQLPAGTPPDRARRAIRSALSPRLGHPRRERRHRHRQSRPRAVPRNGSRRRSARVRSETARPPRHHAGHLGWRVRPDADERSDGTARG